jgi:hypothetical protein
MYDTMMLHVDLTNTCFESSTRHHVVSVYTRPAIPRLAEPPMAHTIPVCQRPLGVCKNASNHLTCVSTTAGSVAFTDPFLPALLYLPIQPSATICITTEMQPHNQLSMTPFAIHVVCSTIDNGKGQHLPSWWCNAEPSNRSVVLGFVDSWPKASESKCMERLCLEPNLQGYQSQVRLLSRQTVDNYRRELVRYTKGYSNPNMSVYTSAQQADKLFLFLWDHSIPAGSRFGNDTCREPIAAAEYITVAAYILFGVCVLVILYTGLCHEYFKRCYSRCCARLRPSTALQGKWGL